MLTFFSVVYACVGFFTMFITLMGIGAMIDKDTTFTELLGDIGKAIFVGLVWPIALPLFLGQAWEDLDE